ncbi:MAG: patatin-like phospholipase family protein [Coprococcus sp.]
MGRKKIKDSYGLVFGGGGGRGSYEIGVWKALEEYGDYFNIGAVSGSSVGALNAALYACGDLNKAEQMWHDITNEKILSNKTIEDEDRSRFFDNLIEKIQNISNPVISDMVEKIGLESVAKGMRIRDGFFSRDGLTDILVNSNILKGISDSDIPCYATCLKVEGKPEPIRFLLNELDEEQRLKVLLASSAIPVVFPMETIDDTRYYDGGFFLGGDSVPIQPLYDEGWRKFIAVHLDERPVARFSDAKIIHIYPSDKLGGALDGMLDFSPEGVDRRCRQGYEDTKIILGEYIKNTDFTYKN